MEGLSTVTIDNTEEESPPATVYTEQEGETGVTYSAIPTQVPGGTVREEIARQVLGESAVPRQPEQQQPQGTGPVLGETTMGRPEEQLLGTSEAVGASAGPQTEEQQQQPQVEWPDRTGPPVRENTPGFFSMAFPWLPGFCHGRADITVPGRPAGNPQFLAYIRHLLHHPSHAFAQDPRFLLYAVNSYQRTKALTHGNVFVKYRCKDITVQSLKDQVATGDFTVFKQLLYFSRSTVG